MSMEAQPEQIILAGDMALRWQPVLTFEVIGSPQQRGSKTVVGKKGGGVLMSANGRPILKDDNPNSRAWMDAVAYAANKAWQRELLDEPLAVSMVFYFNRPKSHYRTGKNAHILRDDAPTDCMKNRDLAKLIRSTEDALTKIVWRDDILVCEYLSPMRREYTTGAERAEITVYRRSK